MKLKNELPKIEKAFAENLEQIKAYIPRLKADGQYHSFENRLAFDCLRAFIGTETMCSWYDLYDCNDTHIGTAGRAALKNLGIIG